MDLAGSVDCGFVDSVDPVDSTDDSVDSVDLTDSDDWVDVGCG